MTKTLTFESTIHFKRGGRGAPKKVREGQGALAQQLPPGRVPRISRLMALAIRFDGLIRAGVVADYAELARLAHNARARITQIMNLLMLAPDIQEEILFLLPVQDPLCNNSLFFKIPKLLKAKQLLSSSPFRYP